MKETEISLEIKERLFELVALDQHRINLLQEVGMRRMAGVTSPKLEREHGVLGWQRGLLLGDIGRLEKILEEQSFSEILQKDVTPETSFEVPEMSPEVRLHFRHRLKRKPVPKVPKVSKPRPVSNKPVDLRPPPVEIAPTEAVVSISSVPPVSQKDVKSQPQKKQILEQQEATEKAIRRYVQIKVKARSFWVEDDESSDRKMDEVRQLYEKERNHQAAISALDAVEKPSETEQEDVWQSYRQKLANNLVAFLQNSMRDLGEKEFSESTKSDLRRRLSQYYRHPYMRAVLGLGVNVGIGTMVATGVWSDSLWLEAGRYSISIAGIEGLLHGLQDFISSISIRSAWDVKFEKLSLKNQQLMLASFYEDRVCKLRPNPGKLETTLLRKYFQQFEEAIVKRLRKNRFRDDLEDIVKEVELTCQDDQLNLFKDETLVFERRSRFVRWALAFLTAGVLNFFMLTSDNILDRLPSDKVPHQKSSQNLEDMNLGFYKTGDAHLELDPVWRKF